MLVLYFPKHPPITPITHYLRGNGFNCQIQMLFLEMNEHWRPSDAYCALCNIHYTTISKTETFYEEKIRILEILGLKAEKKLQRMKRIQTLNKGYFRNIKKNLSAALVDLYKHDFAMFDYDPDLYGD